MARLVSPSGVAAIVHAGKVYRPDRKGVFRVPDDVVADLRPHGLVDAPRDRAVPPAGEGGDGR